MKQAILRTLSYADIFDYPLKIYEIHKWLIGRKSNLRQVEKALKNPHQGEYYFLKRREAIVLKRKRKEKQSLIYFRKAKIICQILKIIPWVKLVGVSGGLAMENAGKSDDIDLFIITAKNRMWISRLLILGLLSIIGQGRKRQDQGRKIAGKLCVNILLEEDKLEQENKDLFTAHEVLQMKVLWQRGGVYSRYLEENSWAFRFLPNWVGELRIMNYELRKRQNSHNSYFMIHDSIINIFENLARRLQLWYMKNPEGAERIENGALYFHPRDLREYVLARYRLNEKIIVKK